MKHLISKSSYVLLLSFWSRFVFIISPHIQEIRQQPYPKQGGPPPRPINHAIIKQNNSDHHVPSSMFVFFHPTPSAFMSKQKILTFPSYLCPPQVQNVPGTSPPAVESSSRRVFRRSTPTTWIARSWSLLPRCRRSFWSSRALSWSQTRSHPLECSAATTAWRFGTASLEVSHWREQLLQTGKSECLKQKIIKWIMFVHWSSNTHTSKDQQQETWHDIR